MLEVMILISGGFLWHRLRENLYRRLFDPPGKITVCQRSCEEINSHFFTAPFYFAFIWFRVQGSGGAAHFVILSGEKRRMLEETLIWNIRTESKDLSAAEF